MSNKLREIEALGQSIWIDNLNRQLLDEGTLRDLIEQDGISGVTSNPTIFEKGMGHSDRYDDAFREVLADTTDIQAIFENLALRDIRDAADLLRPDLRRGGRAGRLRVVRAAGRAGVRRAGLDRDSRAPEGDDRQGQRVHQGPGHRGGRGGVRGADGARRQRERDAAVLASSATATSPQAYVRGVSAPCRGRRAGRPRRLGGELLRLTRGHQGRRRARAARPRGPARQGRRRQRADRLRGLRRDLLRPRVGARSRRPGRTCSGRCGPRPRRRTPTTRTRSTWTT